MISIESLKEAGYQEHKPHKGDGLFQKWIRNDQQKMFALNFYVWVSRDPDRVGFSAEARLYQNADLHGPLTHDGDQPETSFDLDLMVGDVATVENVESFFIQAYTALGCIPDVHNQ